MIWSAIISLLFLLLIALKDIKYRLIPVIFLWGEALASFVLGYGHTGITVIKTTFINMAIVLFQVLLLWGWFRIKERNADINFWSNFGLGDLFMLAIAAINFSTLNYIFFTIMISIISILIWMVMTSINKNQNKTIPFAGFLAVGLMVLRIIQLSVNGANSYSDNYIMDIIYETL